MCGPSPKIIPTRQAVATANKHLENARKATDKKQALEQCKKAEASLEGIKLDLVISDDQPALTLIIAAYDEHVNVLEARDEAAKAQKSRNKASYIRAKVAPRAPVYIPASVSPHPQASRQTTIATGRDGSSGTSVNTATPIPPPSPASGQTKIVPSRDGSSGTSVNTATPISPPSPASGQAKIAPGHDGSRDRLMPISTEQPVRLPQTDNTFPSQNLELIPVSIFAKDPELYAFHGRLPKPDERLDDTRQLAYCLGLLQQDPAELDDNVNAETRTWLRVTRKNKDEEERLKEMAKDLLREFTREELKDARAVAEVVLLAPVFEKDDFRFLLGQFINNLSSSVLLNTRALDGLDYVVQSAPQDNIDADDLVKILEHLNSRLDHTHSDSLDFIYRLTSVVSHVLDAMALGGVQGLDRVNLHTPLAVYLQKLIKSADPYLAFQGAYASQALLWVPNDEEPWQAALRRAGTVTTGLARLVSAAKGLNIVEFIDGLGNIQEGLEGAGQFFGLVKDAFKGVTELIESGQGFQQSLKEGFSFSCKRKWYLALRAADTLLRDGELIKFESLVRDAPCRGDVAFQWGLCHRLGNVAADPHWDPDTRQGAIAFLEEIYRNDSMWGQNVQVKQCILSVLRQLASASDFIAQSARLLLQNLRSHGNSTQQDRYRSSLVEKPSSRPWNVVPPLLKSSPLLDRVQNKKIDIQPRLRKFQRHRLEGRGQDVYIPPEAKTGRQDTDGTPFPLMENVKDFVSSNQRVLLILGDSGAGKSTFNRELEWELWDAYDKDKARIPVFVWLPAIKEPEKNIIAQQLKYSGFSDDHIQELRDYYEFVLICDGYDECHLTCNLYNTNELDKAGKWRAKMVISCRSERLGHSYRSLFQPEDSNGRKGATLLREVVIAPFSTGKIRGYVEKYVEKYASVKTSQWKVENYMRAIEGIPGFQELVSSPFLLKLSLEVLPEIVGQKDLSSVKVTRVALYDKYVENWVKERGEERLANNGKLNGSRKKAFDGLLQDNFTQKTIDFMTRLAVAIFEHQDGKAIVKYPPKDSPWKGEFFSSDNAETTILREASPIIRIGEGNQYKFIHLSFQEYALARAVFEPRRGGAEGGAGNSMNQGASRGMSGNMDLTPHSSSPLYRRSYVNKPSVLQFLAERVQQEPIFEKQLRFFIEKSKKDKSWSVGASNAITILVKARIPFNGADLKGIRIPGADLSGGQFDSAQLLGADLSSASLRNIWLRQANLNKAKMEGVEFGEQPYLTEDSSVNCCMYSPDGKACVFGLYDSTIIVYDTSTWAKIHTLQGHTESVNCVAYSPSGNQIASGCDDKTVRLWDGKTGVPGLILRGHTEAVWSVVYSPSGQRIASGSYDKTVRLWDTKTGTTTLILEGHTSDVCSVAYSPSGKQIASGSDDDTVRVWDAQTGAVNYVLEGHTRTIRSVVYSPSGQQIASASEDETVRLWNAETGVSGHILSGHTEGVRSVAYSPSGLQIASGSGDKTVRLWDVRAGAPGPILSGHTALIWGVVYSPSGQQIASSSEDGTVRLWDVQPGVPGPILSGHTDSVRSVVYSPNGQYIASGSQDETVRLWNVKTGASDLILCGHKEAVNCVVYSPNGQQIASGSNDRDVRLWDAQTGAHGLILSGHTSAVTTVVYSPNGRQIASGSKDKTIRLWDVKDGAPGLVLNGHTDAVISVVYSPNHRQIASCSIDKTVRLWDVKTGAPGPILSGHNGTVWSVVYSRDGQQIVSGSSDKTVRLWEAQTGVPGHTLRGHTGEVWSVAYLPCGKQIASVSGNNTVRHWDAISGQCLVVVDDFHGLIRSIALSPTPESIYFATGCDDGSVCMWQVVEEENYHNYVRLQWTSMHDRLVVSNTSLQGVHGLSKINMRLLKQRGAVSETGKSLVRTTSVQSRRRML